MPRHQKNYGDDVEEYTSSKRKGGGYENEDDYDPKDHPTTNKKKQQENQDIDDFILVPLTQHALLIGKGGSKRQQLQQETNCYIDIPRKEDKSEKIWITGQKRDVVYAKQRIKEVVAESHTKREFSGVLAQTGSNENNFPSLPGLEEVILNVDVEKFAHGKMIGRQHSRLDDLKARLARGGKQGTPDINVVHGIKVVIPEKDDTSSIVNIHVPKHLATTAEQIVKDFFQFYEIQQHLRCVVTVDVSMKGDAEGKGKQLQALPSSSNATTMTSATSTSRVEPVESTTKVASSDQVKEVEANIQELIHGRKCRFEGRSAVKDMREEGYSHEVKERRSIFA